MSQEAAIDRLKAEYPWPGTRPCERKIDWSMDAGGRGMLEQLIRERGMRVVLEIGVFLGGSLTRWLDVSPDIQVVAVDPWTVVPWLNEVCQRQRQPAWVADQLTADSDAFYRSFVANIWERRERVVPIRARSTDVLEHLAGIGLKPDLIYLDGDKTGAELPICQRLFPEAILAGDDWFYTNAGPRYRALEDQHPIRGPVREACARQGGYLMVDKSTWVILEEPPSLANRVVYGSRYHLKQSFRRAKLSLRHMFAKSPAG